MSIWDIFRSSNKEPPMKKEEYWKKRFEESIEGKEIVTRFLVCFGFSHYDDFCGIKEIKGYYGKTFGDNPEKSDWVEDKDTFYQIDFDKSYDKRLHKPSFLFQTKEHAQEAYNENVHLYIDPLQKRINSLEEALVFKKDY